MSSGQWTRGRQGQNHRAIDPHGICFWRFLRKPLRVAEEHDFHLLECNHATTLIRHNNVILYVYIPSGLLKYYVCIYMIMNYLLKTT
jgi:hypothetical protein